MDYKKEIIELIENIHSEKFMKFLYNMIISFKKQWGVLRKQGINPCLFYEEIQSCRKRFSYQIRLIQSAT